jgi:hypothetical protein
MGFRWVVWAAAITVPLGCARGAGPGEVDEEPMTTRERVFAVDGSTAASAPSDAGACGDANYEISGGGVFSGSTCGCPDTRSLTCSAEEHPDARFQFTVPSNVWGCKVTLSEGLAYEYGGEDVPGGCGSDTGAIDPTLPVSEQPGILFGGGNGGRVYSFTVETFGAPCGEYTVTVHCGSQAELI